MGKIIFNDRNEMAAYIKENLLTSAGTAAMLNCSRANISELVKRKKLVPAVELSQTSLFWRSEIEARIASNPKAGRPAKMKE